jgi:hypothetical protein
VLDKYTGYLPEGRLAEKGEGEKKEIPSLQGDNLAAKSLTPS